MARWYIIHAYSGFEGKVRDQILADATRLGLDRLVVPDVGRAVGEEDDGGGHPVESASSRSTCSGTVTTSPTTMTAGAWTPTRSAVSAASALRRPLIAARAQALAHPTWDMGRVVTTNSATLVNKGLELIETHLLFGIDYDRIEVVVHPQSIVHSMVTFTDGSTLAQASPPDMKLPIALALGWPARVPGAAAACDWTTASTWTFEPLDGSVFPAVDLAREAGRRGGSLTAVYNAANEEAVSAFLQGRIGFLGIPALVEDTLAALPAAPAGSLEALLAADAEARRFARQHLPPMPSAGIRTA